MNVKQMITNGFYDIYEKYAKLIDKINRNKQY
uniref:Uncharacterized protein n=1 Tax=Anguilla anguilla TaxID=7936 RepID=A0A0E9X962_ANGAN